MSIRLYFAFLVYLAVHVVWLPVTLVGQLLLFVYQVCVSHDLKCSQMAVLILNWRWIMDIFELRRDETAALLATSLPNNSPLGLRLLIFPDYV